MKRPYSSSLLILGVSLLILRFLAMIEILYECPYPYFEGLFEVKNQFERSGIFHTSNIISIIVVISLILQLRIRILNSIIVVLYPLISVICLIDIASIFILQLPNGIISINTITLHIPTTIVGTCLLFRIKEKASLGSFAFGLVFIYIICMFLIDFPGLMLILIANYCLWLIILMFYTIIIIKYVLIRIY